MTNMFKPSQPSVTTPAPTPTPPPTMPDLASPAALEAKRKAIADTERGGRTSTILTTAATRAQGTLAGAGGATYGSTKLGAP